MKPRLINNGVVTEFETHEDLMAYIEANHAPDPTTVQAAQFILNQAKREKVGRELVNDLFQKLEGQQLTETEEAQIVNKISTCIVALLAGSIKGARIICNALTTDSVFTNGRQNYLLGKIDDVIAEL